MPSYGIVLIYLTLIWNSEDPVVNLCIKTGSPTRRAFFMPYSTSEKGSKIEKSAHFRLTKCGKCFYKVRTSEKQSAGERFLTRLLISINENIHKNKHSIEVSDQLLNHPNFSKNHISFEQM